MMDNNRPRSLLKTILTSSLLYVVAGILLFLYAYTASPSKLFPDNQSWNLILGIYVGTFTLGLLVALILAPKVVKSWATADYWKSFITRFLPKALFYSIILILFKWLIKTTTSINVLQAISNVPLSVLIVHLFVVSQVEELLFGGLIYSVIENKSSKKNAGIITTISFILWHFAKSQGNFILLFTYVPLRLWWDYERNNGTPFINKYFPKLFGSSKLTQQGNAGSHFAWNLFVVAFIEPFRI